MHEKERELFDCLRLIIQNGYELKENDLTDILRFIKIHEIFYFDDGEQKRVFKFLKEVAEMLGFNPEIIDVMLIEV